MSVVPTGICSTFVVLSVLQLSYFFQNLYIRGFANSLPLSELESPLVIAMIGRLLLDASSAFEDARKDSHHNYIAKQYVLSPCFVCQSF